VGISTIKKFTYAPRVAARGHPHPLPEVFLRITHISETIFSILTKLCPNVPCMILFQRNWIPVFKIYQCYAPSINLLALLVHKKIFKY
jgi:hypothetical protein